MYFYLIGTCICDLTLHRHIILLSTCYHDVHTSVILLVLQMVDESWVKKSSLDRRSTFEYEYNLGM